MRYYHKPNDQTWEEIAEEFIDQELTIVGGYCCSIRKYKMKGVPCYIGEIPHLGITVYGGVREVIPEMLLDSLYEHSYNQGVNSDVAHYITLQTIDKRSSILSE